MPACAFEFVRFRGAIASLVQVGVLLCHRRFVHVIPTCCSSVERRSADVSVPYHYIVFQTHKSLLPPPPACIPFPQLFQYHGSSAELANVNAASSVKPAVSATNGNKGKGKANGKGKRKAMMAESAPSAHQDEEDEDLVDGAGDGKPPPVVKPSADGRHGDGGDETGHAMLKSRLTSVSLRGLVQVDDEAMKVILCLEAIFSREKLICVFRLALVRLCSSV